MIPMFPGFWLYCKQNLSGIPFSDLLDMCSNPRHECYQEAWNEFERRYRKDIFRRIHMHLLRWNLAKNVSYVEDISGKITERLLANEYRVLKNFEGRDNEGKFISYLNIMCLHITNKYMKDRRRLDLVDLDPDIAGPGIDPNLNEEKFEYWVEVLQDKIQNSQKSPFHSERDIFVFMLRHFAKFKSKDVAQIPLLNLSDHNVDVISHRFRQKKLSD